MSYTRQGQDFKSVTKSSVEYPVTLVGAQVRTYVGPPQSLSAAGTVTGVTPPAGAEFADIYCQATSSTDFVRYWHGGTNPTATTGPKIKDHEILQSADPATFRFILGTGSGPITLHIEFYKYV